MIIPFAQWPELAHHKCLGLFSYTHRTSLRNSNYHLYSRVMSNAHPRQTSIPIHFHFAHSKRAVKALKDAPRSISTPLRPKKRPASIVIPQDTPVHRSLPLAVQPDWTPVEFSNFSPQLRQSDITDLLEGYNISPELKFPATPRFTGPLRATVLVASVKEARKMVKDLDRRNVGGREISVRIKDITEEKRKEYHIQDMADQIKTATISMCSQSHSLSRTNFSRHGTRVSLSSV